MNSVNQALPLPAELPLSFRGPAPVRTVAGFGFWLFLLSDIVIFGVLFAAYAVLSGETAGGPTGASLFDRKHVLIETACLLVSSVTCGFALLAAQRTEKLATYFWLAATFALGALFLSLEASEFSAMIANGAGPSRSAFLSAFFTLVGTHGLHVSAGLAWLFVMVLQIATLGFQPMVGRRLFCFALFWHALDIVWVGVFTIVYLGAR
ncbi:MAG: cytochrome o ubiquinol oxidase subunit III [Steroidobacteraceae bacterium]